MPYGTGTDCQASSCRSPHPFSGSRRIVMSLGHRLCCVLLATAETACDAFAPHHLIRADHHPVSAVPQSNFGIAARAWQTMNRCSQCGQPIINEICRETFIADVHPPKSPLVVPGRSSSSDTCLITFQRALRQIGRASVGKECRSRWSPYH